MGFTIELKDLKKSDRKEVISIAKRNNWIWYNSDRFKNGEWDNIAFYQNDRDFCYKTDPCVHRKLTLPADWDEFKQLIGETDRLKELCSVGLLKENSKFKVGEVWKIGSAAKKMTIRIAEIPKREFNNNLYYSIIRPNGGFNSNSGFGFWNDSTTEEATAEEEAEFIETEHKNGYHWTSSELIEVPKYIKLIKADSCNWQKDCEGDIFPIDINNPTNDEKHWNIKDKFYIIAFDQAKPATQEEYEKQQEKTELQEFIDNMQEGEIYKLWTKNDSIWLFRNREENNITSAYVNFNIDNNWIHEGGFICWDRNVINIRVAPKEEKLNLIEKELAKELIWNQLTKSYK